MVDRRRPEHGPGREPLRHLGHSISLGSHRHRLALLFHRPRQDLVGPDPRNAGPRQRRPHRAVRGRGTRHRQHRLAGRQLAPGVRHLPAALLHPARVAGPCQTSLPPVRQSGDLARRHLRHLGAARSARPRRPGKGRLELGQRRRRQQKLRDLRHGRGAAVRPGPRPAVAVPEDILSDPVTRDAGFYRPAALTLAAVTHFLMPDDEPTRIIKSRMDAALSGSYVVGAEPLSHSGPMPAKPRCRAARRTAAGRYSIIRARPQSADRMRATVDGPVRSHAKRAIEAVKIPPRNPRELIRGTARGSTSPRVP